ncbi:hypothetical protein B9Z55_021861 [Caenorhabditis nigoni]|uniref:Uncharacterized protein n=1 Tax=Caenorhabditis nigoni TaxID=1611254 RepID=A0A2G5TTS8_9PELO|nr:hypothetical protein B9Z55_021861 [Caenorhabditis nigoni]
MDVHSFLNMIVPDWRNQRISVTNEHLLAYGPVLFYSGPQKILRQAVIQLSPHSSHFVFGPNRKSVWEHYQWRWGVNVHAKDEKICCCFSMTLLRKDVDPSLMCCVSLFL